MLNGNSENDLGDFIQTKNKYSIEVLVLDIHTWKHLNECK